MGIKLKDPRFTFSDEAPPRSLPLEGAVAQRNGHAAGPQTPLEVLQDPRLVESIRRFYPAAHIFGCPAVQSG